MSGKTDNVGVTTMEKLDQGHLSSTRAPPRLTCLGQGIKPGPPLGGEHSRKELFEQLVNSYSNRNFYMSSRRQVFFQIYYMKTKYSRRLSMLLSVQIVHFFDFLKYKIIFPSL
jgi:hypothetical protein